MACLRAASETDSYLPIFNTLAHRVHPSVTSHPRALDDALEDVARNLRHFRTPPSPSRKPHHLLWDISKQAHLNSLWLVLRTKPHHSNIVARSLEPIRSHVVGTGTLEVIGCIWEAWLARKGLFVGPSVAANGMQSETIR